jgi:hypothetical protein
MPEDPKTREPILQPPGEDRRLWVRYPVRLTVHCRCMDRANEFTWPAQIQNISHEGLKMLCRYAVEQGATILISPADPKVLPQLARVVHVTDGSDGSRVVGCVFTRKLLDEKDLLAWVKGQDGKPPADQPYSFTSLSV